MDSFWTLIVAVHDQGGPSDGLRRSRGGWAPSAEGLSGRIGAAGPLRASAAPILRRAGVLPLFSPGSRSARAARPSLRRAGWDKYRTLILRRDKPGFSEHHRVPVGTRHRQAGRVGISGIDRRSTDVRLAASRGMRAVCAVLPRLRTGPWCGGWEWRRL